MSDDVLKSVDALLSISRAVQAAGALWWSHVLPVHARLAALLGEDSGTATVVEPARPVADMLVLLGTVVHFAHVTPAFVEADDVSTITAAVRLRLCEAVFGHVVHAALANDGVAATLFPLAAQPLNWVR